MRRVGTRVLVVLLTLLVLAPVIGYFIAYVVPRQAAAAPKTRSRPVLHVPFSRGDVFTYLVAVYVSTPNGTVLLDNHTITYEVVEPGWPTTIVRVGSEVVEMPTDMLALPAELRSRTSMFMPAVVHHMGEKMCLYYSLYAKRSGGVEYRAFGPGKCKRVAGYRVYSAKDGLLLRDVVTVLLPGSATYTEVRKLVSAVRSGWSAVEVRRPAMCSWFASAELDYVFPWAYLFNGTRLMIVDNISAAASARPLLLLGKDGGSSAIWSYLVRSGCRGLTVVVVSALLRAAYPDLELPTNTVPALVLPDGRTVTGPDPVLRELRVLCPSR